MSHIFYLKRKKTDKRTDIPIYLRITVDGAREDWSTGRRCRPEEWDGVAKRLRGTREKARSVNDWLDTLTGRMYESHRQLYSSGKPFTAAHIRKLMQGEELETPKMLSQVWSYHFTHIASLLGRDYTSGTLKKHHTAYKALKRYMKKNYGAEDIRLDALDFRFIKEYEVFLKADYGVANNTAVQMVRKLKTVVRLAMNFGWLNRDPFIALRMKIDEVHRSYLTAEEISRIALKKYTPKRLNLVRDLFLFSCYTGLSYADTVKLNLEDIVTGEDGGQWVQTHRTKNNNRVRVPLLPPALKLLQFYHEHPARQEDKVFPMISNQKANAYLKEIAKGAGIKKTLTYHIARHTFATTVTLTNGVPLETVGQMLGHKSIKSTQHYARVTDTKVRVDMEPLKEKYAGQELRLVEGFGEE